MSIVTSSSTVDQRESVSVEFDIDEGDIAISVDHIPTSGAERGLSAYLSIADARDVIAALQNAIRAAEAAPLVGAAR